MKKLMAVIGKPIEHSMSPLIHGRAIDSLKLDFVYVAFSVDSAKSAIEAMRALGIRGYSVTIPHKEAVIPFLDELDISAQRCGSVNTVVNTDGHLKGYSTDGPGAVRALQADGVDPAGRHALIVGTGGAARAIAFALVDAGIAGIAFKAEDAVQHATLATDLENAQPGVIRDDGPDILINASPIGMHPNVDEMPLDPSPFRDVFDIVYNPMKTKLLRTAEERDINIITGVGMFAEQAALQFELFTGHVAPRELMIKTVTEALAR